MSSQANRPDDPTAPLLPTGQAGPSDPPGAPGSRPVAFETFEPAKTGSAGETIGPYKLISLLGEGGFGEVWLAERREPFVQRVALKIVHLGLNSKQVVARFEQERQALAVMNHPNIAKVIDGGLTREGRPYFAMEYVKGEPIVEFCDANSFSVRERLALFSQVCEAIQHAHTKGIIHRDIKPSNVLVARGDDKKPQVKVIDFGVAKALAHRLASQTIYTETGQMVGTPEYMSPEQADPDATDIDTRSDVYSLGVMHYQMLTGMLPFEAKELRSKAYREIQRIIREVDPPAPSVRLTTVAAKDTELAAKVAKTRAVLVKDLVRELKSELEWIPLKAMRKDREERYEGPADLARDIENYLAGRPLVAAPESKAYRVRKYLRRNKTALLRTIAVVIAALTLGVGFWPARVAYRDWSETQRLNAFETVEQEPDPAVVTDAAVRDRIKATGKPWKIRHTASGVVMLLVPPGEFTPGPPMTNEASSDQVGRRKRQIPKAFYLSQKEVSQAEWRAITGDSAVGSFSGDDLPIDNVSWDLIKTKFIDPSRGFFRLPSDDEWEYACKAGTTTAYSFGDKLLKRQAQFDARGPVTRGSFPANQWGFYDMHGNLWEWVEDGFSPLRPGEVGGLRALRGGSWSSVAANCGSASRNGRNWTTPDITYGFRVARTPD